MAAVSQSSNQSGAQCLPITAAGQELFELLACLICEFWHVGLLGELGECDQGFVERAEYVFEKCCALHLDIGASRRVGFMLREVREQAHQSLDVVAESQCLFETIEDFFVLGIVRAETSEQRCRFFVLPEVLQQQLCSTQVQLARRIALIIEHPPPLE